MMSYAERCARRRKEPDAVETKPEQPGLSLPIPPAPPGPEGDLTRHAREVLAEKRLDPGKGRKGVRDP